MTKLNHVTYPAAIKLETAQLVVDQGYAQEEAAKAMEVSKSTIIRMTYMDAPLKSRRANV